MARMELNVPCTPCGMPRPRARAMKTKSGKYIATMYQPKRAGRHAKNSGFEEAARFKSAIADAVWRVGRPSEPWTGPLRVTIEAYFDRPKYLLKKSSPAGKIPHTVKPDRDNIDKAVLDALKDVGLLTDDAQVCAGGITKWWVKKGGTPGVVIVIELLDPSGAEGLSAA